VKRYGPLATLLLIVPLLAFGPEERLAPTSWAVVIGISDYIHFEDTVGGDLPGAEYDARAIRNVLVSRWGFPEDNVRMILNQDATRAAIQEALTEWLPSVAQPGDNLVVFFAGHGSQTWDEDGDEDDGLDETLAPADAVAASAEFDITDDELNQWLTALPSEVYVWLDNCNSGTGTRDVTPFSRTRQLGRDLANLPRPEGMSRRALPDQVDVKAYDGDGERILELAAAQPYQAAMDVFFPGEAGGEGFYGGAFTTFLVKELWKADSDATVEDVFMRVRDALKQNRFEQDPYISEGNVRAAWPLFSMDGTSTGGLGSGVPIRSVSGGQVELGAGIAQGIRVGSVFETDSGARIEVTEAHRDDAIARVTAGNPTSEDQARLVQYVFPRAPIRVGTSGVGQEIRDGLRSELSGEPGILLIEEEDAFAHVLVRRRGTELRLVGSDGAVRHTAALGESWADQLATALMAEAAAMRLGEMENPAPDANLTVWLEGEKRSFGIGEMVTFHARSDVAGFLTLVDLGTDGQVTILFPNAFEPSMRVEAGQEVVFPSPEMDFEIVAKEPFGRGMVRAFLTSEPLDLPQDGDFTSGGLLLADRISTALRLAVGGADVEGIAVPLTGWSSASVIYEIRP